MSKAVWRNEQTRKDEQVPNGQQFYVRDALKLNIPRFVANPRMPRTVWSETHRSTELTPVWGRSSENAC